MTADPYAKKKAIIIDHYDVATKYYRLLWGGKAHSLHFGYYDEKHRDHRAAQLNKNRVLADMAGIGPHDRVLDAGCGIGGSALWLARERSATVVGVNISPRQLQTANRLAQQQGLSHRVTFIEADYCTTDLAAASFDVVWALDSVCHAPDKQAFLREAFRLLKPGLGRIVISDGYLTKPATELSTEDQIILKQFEDGFGSLEMISVKESLATMRSVGFRDVSFVDKTKETMPDFARIYHPGRLLYPLLCVLAKAGFISKYVPLIARTAYLHKVGADRGIGVYGIITARK